MRKMMTYHKLLHFLQFVALKFALFDISWLLSHLVKRPF